MNNQGNQQHVTYMMISRTLKLCSAKLPLPSFQFLKCYYWGLPGAIKLWLLLRERKRKVTHILEWNHNQLEKWRITERRASGKAGTVSLPLYARTLDQASVSLNSLSASASCTNSSHTHFQIHSPHHNQSECDLSKLKIWPYHPPPCKTP